MTRMAVASLQPSRDEPAPVTRGLFSSLLRSSFLLAAAFVAGTGSSKVLAIPAPPEPPYGFLVPGGPRAAWLETLGGDRWLAVSSIEEEWCPGGGQPCVPNSRPGVPPPGGCLQARP